MAKIKHAKKFRDLPAPRHAAVMAEIENERQTDRGVAIIGAAYVDLVLRDVIAARLIRDDELMGLLFENRGPLQDFGREFRWPLRLVCVVARPTMTFAGLRMFETLLLIQPR